MTLFCVALLSAALANAQPETKPSSATAPSGGPSEPGGAAPHDRRLLLSTLLGSLKDQDENIRAKAAEDLGRITPIPVEATPDLIRALKDPASIVRNRAAEALLRIGTPKAKKAVMDFRKRLRQTQSW
jgi:hypothetical protein